VLYVVQVKIFFVAVVVVVVVVFVVVAVILGEQLYRLDLLCNLFSV